MKPTIASLSCLIESLRGQLNTQNKRLKIVERRSKAAALQFLKSNDISSMPAGYNKLTGEAKARADASIQRRLNLRNKQQATQH